MSIITPEALERCADELERKEHIEALRTLEHVRARKRIDDHYDAMLRGESPEHPPGEWLTGAVAGQALRGSQPCRSPATWQMSTFTFQFRINMAPHQQRVVDEYEALHTKTLALGKFLETNLFLTLDVAERNLLNRQWRLMNEYGQVLSERIAAFE